MTDQRTAAVEGDDSFDRYARMVRRILRVPVGLVSLVEKHRQVFIGAEGLPEPWQSDRRTPLSHSFCQYVVADRAPLIVTDARTDERLCDNLAIRDLGVIAYAGFPLTDSTGAVIGSLCAIDTEPRKWTDSELIELEDLAASCSAELSLRLERRRADISERRARTLLALSEALAQTNTIADVAAAVARVAADHLGCEFAGIWLQEGDELLYQPATDLDWPQASGRNGRVPVDGSNPLGAVAHRKRPGFYPTTASLLEVFPQHPLRHDIDDRGARALMPLVVAGQRLGVLALQWPQQHAFTDDDRVTIAALTNYTAQAVAQAELLAERVDVAATLQRAMLSDLPALDVLELAARYRPAAVHDQVGGDWYDALRLSDERLWLAVGDVMGHDMAAAAAMGQVRSMLRTLIWSDVQRTPGGVATALSQAMRDLSVGPLATLVLAAVERTAGGQWSLTWSNSAAPPPILVDPSGTVSVLDDGGYDTLLGLDTHSARDRHALAGTGSMLLMYTDGLVETRTLGLDEGIERLAAALTHQQRRTGTADLGVLLDAVLDDMLGEHHEDDVVALLARLP